MIHLFIIPSITNYFTFLEDIAIKLFEDGHTVHLATSTKHISLIECYNRKIQGELHEIEFPRGFALGKHLRAARELRELVDKIKPDLINVHFSAGIFTAALAKRKKWPKMIGTYHGLSFPVSKGWRKTALGIAESWAAKKLDVALVLTKDDAIALSKSAPGANVQYLKSQGLGCDLSKFKIENIPNSTKSDLLSKLNIDHDHFVFIFVGRQVHFKGFDKLIRAFVNLFCRNIKIRLILVGDRDNIHSTHLSATEERILRNCPGIIKVGWQENVNDYLSVADVNVFPSVKEGMPVNLMESLAMGVPVITINSRGCREVVAHNFTGILLDSPSVEKIQSSMQQLFEDAKLLDYLSENALAVRSKFDRLHFIKEQLEIFHSVLTNTISKSNSLTLN